MFEVIMPKLGLTMETGTIERWLKKEGDKVKEGDILFEVMTDKVSLEVESYNSGILKMITHFEGEEVPVTEVVAYIGEYDEKIPDIQSPNPTPFKNAAAKPNQNLNKDAEETSKTEIKDSNFYNTEMDKNKLINRKIFITPLARKKARELNIDYKNIAIKGSGPRNRIVKDDILKLYTAKEESRKAERISHVAVEEISGSPAGSSSKLQIRRNIIDDRTVLSKQTIPQIIISSVANVSELVILKGKIQKKAEELFQVRLTYLDFIIKSAAMALRKNIKLNSAIVDDRVIVYEEINIGIAAGEKGHIVPLISNADKLSIAIIAKKRSLLTEKINNNTISIDEISGSTFTVYNLGMNRVRSFTTIINPAQTAILTVGEIYKNLVMDEENNIKQEYFMNISVAVDHRAIDMGEAAAYMQTFLNYLENPYFI